MLPFPIFIAIYAGFTHAFETDHLLAVSSIVSQRNSTLKSLKDGVFWGLGHSSTILLVGMLMLMLKVQITPHYFQLMEVCVGVMLIALGLYRLLKLFPFLRKHKAENPAHGHTHEAVGREDLVTGEKKGHMVSYGVGLVHGLAGSGELVLLVMIQMASPKSGLLYLLIFGMGSILGMVVAAALFRIPYSKKILQASVLQASIITLSSLMCIAFGSSIIYKNWLL